MKRVLLAGTVVDTDRFEPDVLKIMQTVAGDHLSVVALCAKLSIPAIGCTDVDDIVTGYQVVASLAMAL